MKIVLKIKLCQNVSKFQDKIEESRRENGKSGEDSQPLRENFLTKKIFTALKRALKTAVSGLASVVPPDRY